MNTESPQVRQIRERYKASLTEKSEMIERHLSQVANAASEDNLSAVKEDLHKLAGSSGMYGYNDIALLSRTGMSQIDQLEVDDLQDSLSKLRDLLRQHA